MHLGLEIKKGWANFGEKNLCPNDILYTDINNIKNELYSTLREYVPLDRLRKENPVLESELNTSFQTHLFDLLNDQDDLYDFYNGEFDSSMVVRNDNLPLANSLENINAVISEFKSDKQKLQLARFRWYASDELTK
jgi:hypothetical protein